MTHWKTAFYLSFLLLFLFACLPSLFLLSVPRESRSRFPQTRRRDSILPSLTNSEYLSLPPVPKDFSPNDTSQVTDLTSLIAAVPPIFGYSEEDGNRIFPHYEYPRCIDKNPPAPRSDVMLDYRRKLLLMKCGGDFQGKFVLGPIYNVTFTNQYELYNHWKVREYKGPVKLRPETEFVIASCRPQSRHFELHKTAPRPKREVKFRAIRRARRLGSRHKKPLIIAMVTVDSFSRNHFYRKLPRVVKLLSTLEQENEWKVFDFKVHNIIGTDTAENQARIFASSFTEVKETGYRHPDKLGSDAIWAKLRRLGFVSMLGFEACAFKIKSVLGRKPAADHVVNPFYCANYRFSSYTSSKHSGPVQRCLGSYMSHVYLMNYTLDFMNLYQGANQWAYNHFTAAHESTGQHASTLDQDLRDYLKSMIDQFGEENDLVIFLMGDHGMRYGGYKSGTSAVQEHRLPAFFLITKHSFLKKTEYSYDTLEHNSLRLTTKPDIRRTVLALARRHYGLKPPKERNKFVDLFTEKVRNSRTCADAEIPMWYCSSAPLEHIPDYVYDAKEKKYAYRTPEERDLGHTLHSLARDTIIVLSEHVHSPTFYRLGRFCKKITFREILMANSAWSKQDQQYLYKLTIGINEDLAVRLDAYILVSEVPEAVIPATEQDEYRSFPVLFRHRKLYAKVVMAFRLDRYAGTCERVAREADIEAEHCICTQEALVGAVRKKLRKH